MIQKNIYVMLTQVLVPGGIDVHVHSRDPGHTQKEDWKSLEQSCLKRRDNYCHRYA